jgi:hypothetical protein
MKKAVSLIVNSAADSGGANLKGTDEPTCKKARVGTKLVTPNSTQDCLSMQSPGRLMA